MGIKDGKPCKSCGEFDYYPSGKCRTCHNLQVRKWRQANPEKQPEYVQKWKDNNPEKLKTIRLKYKKISTKKEKPARNDKETIEKRRQYVSKYTSSNKDKRRALKQKRRALVMGNGGEFTPKEWRELCESNNYKCLCCGRTEKLSADHVLPLSKGGPSNIDNIQPLCRPCNSSKGNKHIDYRNKQ